MPAHADQADTPVVLALNSGSSSLKFGLYKVRGNRISTLMDGEATGFGGKDSGGFKAKDADGRSIVDEHAPLEDQRAAMARIDTLLSQGRWPQPTAIGHRVVHGGATLRQHCLIDKHVERTLEEASDFAPLHTPPALAVIKIATEHFANVPQVACFDTAFHAHMPDVARTLPLPADLRDQGVQRYGFHGLSCESIMRQLGDRFGHERPARLVIAHLGNGASVTAVRDGVSVDTSMGLSPSGGVIMGTRSGDLDPGVLVYLARVRKFDAARLEDLVDHRSGLKGISGISSDMRALHDASTGHAAARLAIDMFCYSVRKQVAAMSIALDGAEAIVFTGGIGENDAVVREMICGGLGSIGVARGAGSAKTTADDDDDMGGARCHVHVMPSLEDEQIALHAAVLTAGRSA